jgi:hypothetical protein
VIDIDALLSRGGELSSEEMSALARDLTHGKLLQMINATEARTLDQPVKVVAYFEDDPNPMASGYFTQQKFIWGATPEEMERILGTLGMYWNGACVLEFLAPLQPSDYENKAYTYLPNGKKYEPDSQEKRFLPGDGATQWRLRHPVPAKCIARLRPGQPFNKSWLIG